MAQAPTPSPPQSRLGDGRVGPKKQDPVLQHRPRTGLPLSPVVSGKPHHSCKTKARKGGEYTVLAIYEKLAHKENTCTRNANEAPNTTTTRQNEELMGRPPLSAPPMQAPWGAFVVPSIFPIKKQEIRARKFSRTPSKHCLPSPFSHRAQLRVLTS